MVVKESLFGYAGAGGKGGTGGTGGDAGSAGTGAWFDKGTAGIQGLGGKGGTGGNPGAFGNYGLALIVSDSIEMNVSNIVIERFTLSTTVKGGAGGDGGYSSEKTLGSGDASDVVSTSPTEASIV